MIAKDIFASLAGVMRRMLGVLKHPRVQPVIWVAAVVIFFGGFAASIAAQPSLIADIRIETMLIVVFVLCPMMTAANMLTTREAARFAGARLTYLAAFKLAVMSTAANHLPAPGGPLLRVVAFQSAGARLKDAGLANIAVGFIWMSATFLLAGQFALFMNSKLAAMALGPSAIFLLAAIVLGARLPGGLASMARLFAISYAAANLYAGAIYFALASYGEVWSMGQAAIVSVAGVIGAAVSITPSGLGVREAAAAGLATMIGAQPAAAFAATASVHAAMLAVMGVSALIIAGRRRETMAR